MATQAIQRTDEPKGIRALLESDGAVARIEPFLPKGVDYRRVVAAAQLAVKANPGILECTPESIVLAVAKAQQWGGEVGEDVHLVPFNVKVKGADGREEWQKVCTPIADYKFLAKLIRASGAVRHVEARCVFEGEEFDIVYGTEGYIRHRPFTKGEARGALLGAYVIFRLPFNVPVHDFMPIEDIEAIRKSSKQWNPGKVKECPPWYAKKTVIRQAVKLLPRDRRLGEALKFVESEAAEELGEEPAETPVTVYRLRDEDRIEAPAAAQLTEGEAAPAAELALDDRKTKRNAQED